MNKLTMRSGRQNRIKIFNICKQYLSENLIFRRASGDIIDKENYLTALADDNIAVSVVIVKGAGIRGVEKKPFSGIFKNIRFFRRNPGWELYAWYNEVVN